MTKRDEILQCTEQAAKGAGFDPEDEHIRAMRRNIAAVWLADYQLEREELVEELRQIRDAHLRLAGFPDASLLEELNALIAKLA